ncbi:hypothetical protein DIPPA_10403 [Diplonema papillatum]|nr:hypothetical protein DIPPA_10403 [Diplonema papillatum]
MTPEVCIRCGCLLEKDWRYCASCGDVSWREKGSFQSLFTQQRSDCDGCGAPLRKSAGHCGCCGKRAATHRLRLSTRDRRLAAAVFNIFGPALDIEYTGPPIDRKPKPYRPSPKATPMQPMDPVSPPSSLFKPVHSQQQSKARPRKEGQEFDVLSLISSGGGPVGRKLTPSEAVVSTARIHDGDVASRRERLQTLKARHMPEPRVVRLPSKAIERSLSRLHQSKPKRPAAPVEPDEHEGSPRIWFPPTGKQPALCVPAKEHKLPVDPLCVMPLPHGFTTETYHRLRCVRAVTGVPGFSNVFDR